jgi:hypothetical protein
MSIVIKNGTIVTAEHTVKANFLFDSTGVLG